MKRVVHKLFWAWDFEKEEKWINEMSAKGLQLCGVGLFKYIFEEGMPGEYTYRIELLDQWPTHIESVQYIHFLEDAGVEHVGSLMRWVYLRSKNSSGREFDLFSDLDSRIKHLNRLLVLIGVVAGVNTINGLNQLVSWLSRRFSASLIIGIVCLSFSLFAWYGFSRIYSKKARLKKEKVLRE